MHRRTFVTALPGAGFLLVSTAGNATPRTSAKPGDRFGGKSDVSLYIRDWGSGPPI